jgi:hypothetical protein
VRLRGRTHDALQQHGLGVVVMDIGKHVDSAALHLLRDWPIVTPHRASQAQKP